MPHGPDLQGGGGRENTHRCRENLYAAGVSLLNFWYKSRRGSTWQKSRGRQQEKVSELYRTNGKLTKILCLVERPLTNHEERNIWGDCQQINQQGIRPISKYRKGSGGMNVERDCCLSGGAVVNSEANRHIDEPKKN